MYSYIYIQRETEREGQRQSKQKHFSQCIQNSFFIFKHIISLIPLLKKRQWVPSEVRVKSKVLVI